MLSFFRCGPCAVPSRKGHALRQRGGRVTSVRVVAGEHALQHVASRRALLGGALLGFSIYQGWLEDGPDGRDYRTRMFIPPRNRLLIRPLHVIS